MSIVCPICGGRELVELPIPVRGRALLSDGRLVARDLSKRSCLSCGAVTHTSPLGAETMAEIYRECGLSRLSPSADRARAEAYAAWLLKILGNLDGCSVLEVGCGSGALLRSLAAKACLARAIGLDPALPSLSGASSAEPRFLKGYLQSFHSSPTLDLVLAVNVIEHIPDPVALLAAMRERLAPNGRIAIVCPSATPNVELMFYDHLTTFTRRAFHLAGQAAGCRIVAYDAAPRQIGDFQLFVLAEGGPEAQPNTPALLRDRTIYLGAWQRLDAALAAEFGEDGEVCLFGASETAALIRAYIPRVWERVSFLTVDRPEEAWPLDRPILPYKDVRPTPSRAMIVAVTPGRQAPTAARLIQDGHKAVAWDDKLTPGAEPHQA
jgi:SAM-dependent methyltransferase